MVKRIIGAALLLGLAMPAAAATSAGVDDPYGGRSIAKGRIDRVDERLSAAFSRGDRDPEVLLNLAAIRLRQQDATGAQALYRMILAQPNVDMATLSGSAWSHDIAERALALPVLAARR